MPEIVRPSGVRIDVADDLVTLADAAAQQPEHRKRRRSARRSTTTQGAATAAGAQPTDETVALLAALEADEITVVDAIDVAPRPDATPARRRGRRRGDAAHASLDPVPVTVDVPLAPGEEAVVLVEEDGVYSWIFGTAQPGVDARPATRRRGGAKAPVATHSKRFAIELALDDDPDDAPAMRRRRARRGFFRRTLIGKAVVYVLKFAGRKAIGAIVRRKEKHVVPGLIDMTTAGGTRFPRLDLATRTTPLPTDRPLKILLFVHGTFSSTLGSYGWLDMTPDGKAFLEAAHAAYDLVVGYDHRTLSETPQENAQGLFDALVGLPSPAGPPHIDAVAYSRGGLVLRTFLEEVLPANGWAPAIGTCSYVACTHAGTQLASEKNAKRFVDRYTNLAVGACRGVALIPGATPWAMLASTILGGLGELVKELAEWALEDGGIPGLAAMEPTGDTVKRLNAALARSGTTPDYRVIESTFDLTRAASSAVPGALDSFVMRLKDNVADELLGVPNDLVVDVASMTAIGGDPARFVKARHDFGVNPSVHHCNYFVQPATVGALASWLGMALEGGTVATGGTRRRRRRGGKTPAAGAVAEAPAAFATGLVFADGLEPIGLTLDKLHDAPETDYVVVVRSIGGRYAVTPDEIVAAAGATDPLDLGQPLESVLDLHEYDVSESGAASDAPAARDAGRGPSSARRLVGGGAVIGVVASADDMLDESRTLYPERAAEARQRTIAELTGRGEKKSAKPPRRGDDGADGDGGDRPGWAGSEPVAMLPPSPDLDFGGGGRTPARGGGTSTKPKRRGSKKPVAQPTDTGTYQPPTAGTAPTKVDVFMAAGTDAEWTVGEPTEIEVRLSREQIDEMIGQVGGATSVGVDATLPITLHVAARTNATVGADALREVALPAAGTPRVERFTATANAAGIVCVDVLLMQNRVRLAGMTLMANAVAKAKKGRAAPARAEATATVTPAPSRAPVDILRVSEDPSAPQPNALIRYDVSFEGVSVAPRVRGQAFSEQLKRERRAYIDGIYTRIQDRWEDNADDAQAFARDLRAIGIELWNAIVPERIQKLLWERRASLDGLQVLSTEAYVPWELVYLNEPGATRAHAEGRYLGELGLTRWIYGSTAGTGFAPDALRWGRMRVVQPEYTDDGWALDGAREEAHALVRTYKAKRVDARPNTVYTLVNDGSGWDVLHYCGHGEAEAATIEEAGLLMDVRTVDGEEKKDVVLASTIASEAKLRADGDLTGPGHIVVLNACQVGRAGETLVGTGGFARAFIEGGAGLFVAPLWSVGDDLASTFCETLYARLVAGDTVAQATRAARTAARDAGDATWLSYAVYGEPTARIVKG